LWGIHFAVVDTRSWLPGCLVFIAPEWIERVDWEERRAHVCVTRDAVKSSPPYGRSAVLQPEDEACLCKHYGL
jgi:hypothetical protein